MAATTAVFEQIGYNSSDGSQWGRASSERIAMYGATPVVCQSVGLGLSSATHASTLISSLVEALKLVGIVQT